MLRYSKAVSKAARMVEIGVEQNPRSICDSCFVPITCGRNWRGPALDADQQAKCHYGQVAWVPHVTEPCAFLLERREDRLCNRLLPNCREVPASCCSTPASRRASAIAPLGRRWSMARLAIMHGRIDTGLLTVRRVSRHRKLQIRCGYSPIDNLSEQTVGTEDWIERRFIPADIGSLAGLQNYHNIA